jgi:hypothetical protein
MVGVTVITGVLAFIEWLTYLLDHIDRKPSLADIRMYREGRNLFWPALLVTGALWLARSVVLRGPGVMRVLPVALCGIALYGVVTSTILGKAADREPLVMRVWECPPGLRGADLTAQDPTCTERPIGEMTWFIIEEDAYFNVDAPTLRLPSSQEGNTATWDGLPEGLYVIHLATSTDLSSHESVGVISIRDGAAWGYPQNMSSDAAVGQPYWTARVEISPQHHRPPAAVAIRGVPDEEVRRDRAGVDVELPLVVRMIADRVRLDVAHRLTVDHDREAACRLGAIDHRQEPGGDVLQRQRAVVIPGRDVGIAQPVQERRQIIRRERAKVDAVDAGIVCEHG